MKRIKKELHGITAKGPLVALACASAMLSGCSMSAPELEGEKDPKVYSVSFRQLPPQPTYNRIRFVHLPEVLPSRELPQSSDRYLSSMVHLELTNASLEETSSVLAAASRYTSYCASSIASNTITINSLGSIEELAREIAEKAGIDVVVDHENRQIRFLAGTLFDSEAPAEEMIEPEFYESGETS